MAATDYYKRHLVPFGEYLPFDAWTRRCWIFLQIPMSDFSPGGDGRPLLTLAGQLVGVDICYEDAYGAEVARAAGGDPARQCQQRCLVRRFARTAPAPGDRTNARAGDRLLPAAPPTPAYRRSSMHKAGCAARRPSSSGRSSATTWCHCAGPRVRALGQCCCGIPGLMLPALRRQRRRLSLPLPSSSSIRCCSRLAARHLTARPVAALRGRR